MDKMKLYLLQSPQVQYQGKEVFQELNTKAKGLFFYLAMNKKQTLSREQLSEMFWPEQSPEYSRSNLRQALSGIRRAASESGLADPLIRSEKGGCSIAEPQLVWVDVLAFRGALKQVEKAATLQQDAALLQEAVDLYQSGFLEGFHVKGSSAVEEWLLFERETLSQDFARACLKLAAIYEQAFEEGKAVSCLLKLLKTNPLQEDVHRGLMSLYHRQGLRYKAIEQYQQCAGILRSELNLSPMEETEALYKRILQEESRQRQNETPAGTNRTARNHHYFLESEQDTKDKISAARERAYRDKKPPVLLAEALAEFSPVDYSGYYQLLTAIDQAKIEGQTRETATALQTVMAESTEAGRLHTMLTLIDTMAAHCSPVLCFRCFEELDEPTKRLACFLLHHCRHPNTHILVSFRKQEALKGVFDKIDRLPNSSQEL